jgi:Domain of unknown function (DUF4214)/IPT/TIG domain/SdrD B-like domain/Invasin, domain 3
MNPSSHPSASRSPSALFEQDDHLLQMIRLKPVRADHERTTTMLELSRLLESVGGITWWPSHTKRRPWLPRRRQPVRHRTPLLQELESRLVPTLLGKQLFPLDYPWNQNISNAPVAANSAAVIAHIGSSIRIHPDWGDDNPSNGTSPLYGIPFNVVHGNTNKVNVIIDNYPSESDISPVPIPANAVIEGDYQNGPNPGIANRGDSHLLVWDEDNNIAYELFSASRPSENADGQWHAAQESIWNMNTDAFRTLGYTSADAAGLSILAGLARPDEGLPTSQGGQGAINHALRFTLPSGDVNAQYIYPASHVVSGTTASNKLPFGARLRLVNTPAVNAVIAGLGPEAQIIARAMQQYGLILADIGSAMYVTGTSASQDANNNISLTWNMSDVLGLSALTASDFQVVDLTPVVTGVSPATDLAGSTVTITGQNFSGAAGHLSVFFGSTLATSVSFVDDSHITAVVPAGSGTVNVQVQSGVNETDPNNPSDNVNNPTFGYGISASSTADQFTYGIPMISGTNSTAGFLSSLVPAGSPDTLSILVEDTAGNAVSGLSNSNFGLSLSGGTSAGTLGTVTETPTPGVYTVTFTGTTVGTASTLTTVINGVTLTARPTVQVTAQGISGIVFDDYNTNGVQDPGEPGLAGQTVFVDLNDSGVLQAGDPTAITDANGNFQLGVPSPGTYTLRQVLLGGVLLSAPAGGSYQVMVNSGADLSGQNFADVPTSIAVPLTLSPNTPFPAQGNANADYVQALYRAILDRNADLGGLANWTGLLGNGTLSRLQVVQGIRNSVEHFTQEVTDFYFTLLGRAPDSSGLQNWVQHLESGMREEQIAFYFLDSPEYLSQGDKHFVDAMYQSLLGRSFDTAGEANWLGQLGDDASGNPTRPAVMTHEQVIAAFLYSTESETRLTEGYYEVFLQRTADAAGLNGWLGQLQQGAGFLTTGQQFLSSDEFYNRAAQQG